jgi:hypothetical protein
MIENKLIGAQSANSITTEYNEIEIGLPIFAVCLDILPVLVVFLDKYTNGGLPAFVFLAATLAPIAGLISGIVSLSKGKARIGLVGFILAVAAIGLPLSIIGFVIFFIFGVTVPGIQMGM